MLLLQHFCHVFDGSCGTCNHVFPCFCLEIVVVSVFVFDFQVRGDGDAHDAEMRAARWIAMFHVASHVTLACAAVSFFPR